MPRTAPFPAGFAALRNSLAIMHKAGEGDFTLVCGEKQFKVYKFLLKAYSDVLYRMATAEEFVESRTGQAELKEVDPEHINCMVRYFYCAEYVMSVTLGEEYNDCLEFHVNMAILADMYNVTGLKTLAIDNMREFLPSRVNTREKLAVVLDMVYADDVPEEVREAVVDYVAQHPSRLHDVAGKRELFEKHQKFTNAAMEKIIKLHREKVELGWGSDGDESQTVSGLSSISDTISDA